MRAVSRLLPACILLIASWSLAQTFDPHGDPTTGVLRVTTDPPTQGECSQCHSTHGDEATGTVLPKELFTQNTNQLCFTTSGDGACHQAMPSNYPLDEIDRIPETEPEAAYFEANTGGTRLTGVDLRGRWPGETVYTDPGMTASGHYFSPHAHDADMPRRDPGGEGMCLNCHDPHGTDNPFDILIGTYRGVGGANAVGLPVEYEHCLQCHSSMGPAGMDPENQLIADFYDPGLNRFAGHMIMKDPNIALSWPASIEVGDMMPCYNCHNPHGSQGNSGAAPNAFLISDQRPEWSNLTDTLNDPTQARQFCFGCHIPADGVAGSKTVMGIVMNTLPNKTQHLTVDPQNRACQSCHGDDYSRARGNNVHNPKS